jgi:hypothetical protein
MLGAAEPRLNVKLNNLRARKEALCVVIAQNGRVGNRMEGEDVDEGGVPACASEIVRFAKLRAIGMSGHLGMQTDYGDACREVYAENSTHFLIIC